MSSGVKDKDLGYADLVKKVFKLDATAIAVGILSTASEEVVQIASAHEFGLGVPERSFLRSWFDQNESKAQALFSKLLLKVIARKLTKERAIEFFGLWLQGEIQKNISEGNISPSLALETVERKGSSTPLIDTGQLRSNISYRIENK